MNTWFISDTHFFHDNILSFKTDGGDRLRPMFDSIKQMHECICDRWNERIKTNDKVFHLGDVAFKMTERADEIDRLFQSLNGIKHLCLGNHDDGAKLYPYFRTIMLWRVFYDHDFFCSHIPLPKSEFREARFQVHGHLHDRTVPDPAYINVSVEMTNYAPVHMDSILQTIAARATAMAA